VQSPHYSRHRRGRKTCCPGPSHPSEDTSAERSTKDFPQEVKAPTGAPNVLLILTDDAGFGASSTFGGPVPTPTMDRLARDGLRYTQFHTTALCSPTRASLLTGRNHHSAADRHHHGGRRRFPGAPGTAHAPHHAPKDWIAKFKGQFDQGWDKAREETLARQKAQGVVPQDTQLTERSEGIPAWDSLDADHKRVAAHMMEVYAAALNSCDSQMGRVVDAIADMGKLDNTLIIYIQGDNGASAEGGPQGLLNEMSFFNAIPEEFSEVMRRMDELGGPTTFNHYPIGWAHAMDTPFQWTKQIASHFGGTRNGMVISWPDRIKDKGGVRTQFHHVIDIAPTILEAVGVQMPAMLNGVPQKPIEGVSMVYSFDDPKAASTRRTQYFEMFANRAIHNDGWVAATTPPLPPWGSGKTIPVDDYKWELYDITKDFSQANNLPAKEPQKLREMQELFWIEAARRNVLPLDNSKLERMNVDNRPSLTRGRALFTYYPGMTRIPEGSAPSILNKSFKIGAELTIPAAGAEGVLVTQGRALQRMGPIRAGRKAGLPLQHRGRLSLHGGWP
jgi:arylsulfatase A-like enzyme